MKKICSYNKDQSALHYSGLRKKCVQQIDVVHVQKKESNEMLMWKEKKQEKIYSEMAFNF